MTARGMPVECEAKNAEAAYNFAVAEACQSSHGELRLGD